ncbi:MAG: NUDIX domain-containing protein [Pseudomonadota bacterium]
MDLNAGPKLIPSPAVAALIVTDDGRYLLQHRDDFPRIFFPGFWGLFGGAVEPGEKVHDTLHRELAEELGFTPRGARHFATTILDFGFGGYGPMPRHFFEVAIAPEDVDTMVLGEGQGLGLVAGPDVLTMPNVVPYDATAVWQHMTRHRY